MGLVFSTTASSGLVGDYLKAFHNISRLSIKASQGQSEGNWAQVPEVKGQGTV